MKYKILSLLIAISFLSPMSQTPPPGCIEHLGEVVCIVVTPMASQTDAQTPIPIPTSTPTQTITPTVSFTPTAAACSETEYIIYKNSGAPFNGTISSNMTPVWSGAASSANLFWFHADLFKGRKIRWARWVILWNPNTGTIPTGVKLVSQQHNNGYLETVLAEVTTSNYTAPLAWARDITASLQGYVDSGTPVLVGHKPYGNGTNGVLIYGSWVEVLWACP